MILYRRRMNYRSFLIVSIALILIINIIPRTPIEVLTTVFYYVVLPMIIIISITVLTSRKH